VPANHQQTPEWPASQLFDAGCDITDAFSAEALQSILLRYRRAELRYMTGQRAGCEALAVSDHAIEIKNQQSNGHLLGTF
jgi:hypothetical protein